MNLKRVEQFLFILTAGSLLLPLSKSFPVIQLYFWNIPALFLWIFSIIRHRKESGRWGPVKGDIWDISIIGLWLSLILFTLKGDHAARNIPFLMEFLTMTGMALYMRRVWGYIVTPRMVSIMALTGIAVQSITGLLQQLTSSQIGNPKAYFGHLQRSHSFQGISRIQGTLDQPNLVGNWIITLLPFAAVSDFYIDGKYGWITKWIVILLGWVGLLLTLSRGNIGFFVILCVIFAYPWLKKVNYPRSVGLSLRQQRMLGGVIAGGCLIIILTNLSVMKSYYNALQQRVEQTLSSTQKSKRGAAGFRMQMNVGALQQIGQNPFTGLGFKNSRFIWTSVDAEVPPSWKYRPHNVYLAMAVEGGILAFIFYLLYTCLPLYYLWKNVSTASWLKYPFLFALLAGFFFAQIYLTHFQPEYGVLYAIILGCSMGYYDEQSSKVINSGSIHGYV